MAASLAAGRSAPAPPADDRSQGSAVAAEAADRAATCIAIAGQCVAYAGFLEGAARRYGALAAGHAGTAGSSRQRRHARRARGRDLSKAAACLEIARLLRPLTASVLEARYKTAEFSKLSRFLNGTFQSCFLGVRVELYSADLRRSRRLLRSRRSERARAALTACLRGPKRLRRRISTRLSGRLLRPVYVRRPRAGHERGAPRATRGPPDDEDCDGHSGPQAPGSCKVAAASVVPAGERPAFRVMRVDETTRCASRNSAVSVTRGPQATRGPSSSLTELGSPC